MNLIKTLNFIATLLILMACTVSVFGQFRIKVPKIKKPKVKKTQPKQKVQETNAGSAVAQKQMVMDDAYTFFDAEPVKEYDSSISLNKDIGWYLKPKLRILGSFPRRSSFLLKVKKNGKELSKLRCEGLVTKDYMHKDYQCGNKEAVNREIGKMNIEVYFINGDTDKETLIRTYKIDVHKATRVRGSASKPQPDVSHYYIQRHAETAVAFAYFKDSRHRDAGYFKRANTDFSDQYRTLYIHTTYSPASNGRTPSRPFARCTVNGQRIDFTNNLNKDNVRMFEGQQRREVAIYTDRKAAKYKRGSAYKDQVEFVGLSFQMPIYTGKENSSLDFVKIEENQGTWECKIMANGETYRTFRWEVVGNKIVQHAEQKSGNVNLFYDAAIIDMEIPTGGSPIDYRLMPMPNASLFYGIPWTSSEGKKMAAGVPKKGNPFHVSSTKAK